MIVMGVIIIIALVPIIYNIIHKEFNIILINIIALILITILELIAMNSDSNFSAIMQLIVMLYMLISTIILIIKMVAKYFIEKRIEKYKCVGIIITILFFFLYLISMSMGHSLPAIPKEEYEEYMKDMRRMTAVTRMMFEIPLINVFFMTMFENKEEKGE